MSTDINMLKSKEEVIDFLRNLGIQYRYGCYEEKNPEACELLAEYVELVERNIEKSTKLYRFTCESYSIGKSCHNYANSLFYGRGIKKDACRALDYYSRACLSGHAVSCFNAGQMYFSENKEVRAAIKRDLDKAATLFEKGCVLNNPDSCSLGTYLYYSNFAGMRETKDKPALKAEHEEKALRFAERGCKLNELNCCVYLAKAYKDGLGCEKSPDQLKVAEEKVQDLLDQYKKKDRPADFQRFT